MENYINNLNIIRKSIFSEKTVKFIEYINGINNPVLLKSTFKRFLEIIPKDLIKQISFYAKFSLFS